MVFENEMDTGIADKLRILADAAKYDVACTSSGVKRSGKKGFLGSTEAAGICHTFAADGRCISLLKILFTNECIYNCKYCINRVTNDVPRATFTPEEVCRLTISFYRRNYIEGLFLSSGIVQSPDYTMELICQTLIALREKYKFNGYIHCKTIPGASKELVELAGWYADRMSVNLELPTESGLKELAPNKSRRSILTPMRQIQSGMAQSRELLGMKGGNQSAYWHTSKRLNRPMNIEMGINREVINSNDINKKAINSRVKGNEFKNPKTENNRDSIASNINSLYTGTGNSGAMELTQYNRVDTGRGFVPSGQSTQMIIGASGESDFEILSVTEALYRQFDLKRVFFSAFINVNNDISITVDGQPPLRREHRLYQADWLLRYYGFEADELLSEKRPFFNTFLDPKCDWALGHMEKFPVEINTADYDTLLRVPGIGVKSARRIVAARRTGRVDFDSLKAMGVVLKRAIYFITCSGRMMYDFLRVDEDYITRNLVSGDRQVMEGFGERVTYRQLSLFDDFGCDMNYE